MKDSLDTSLGSDCVWDRQDLNLRPSDYESPALTAELRSLVMTWFYADLYFVQFIGVVSFRQQKTASWTATCTMPVPRERIELSTQGFSVLCSTTELPRLN